MKVAAFIPARGGSKRVPGKNLQRVGPESLVRRAVAAAVGAGCEPWVSTDDWAIVHDVLGVDRLPDAAIAQAHDTNVIGLSTCDGPRGFHLRPPQLASDHAQIEDALAHWWRRGCGGAKPDVIVILQPTAPFRTAAHVRDAIALLHGANLDSVVGVVQSHAPHFAGRMKPRLGDEEAPIAATWYEWQPFAPTAAESRPRTQDLAPRGHECGALYAFTREHWERTGSRLGGRMAALPLTWIEGLDIDTPDDLAAARAIAEGLGL